MKSEFNLFVQETTMAIKNFELAYMVDTVKWDGKVISQSADAKIADSLDLLNSIGISEVMLSGYQLEEPADFDLFEGAKHVGEMLFSRGMRASQHHGLSSTFAPVGSSQAEVRDKLKRVVEITAQLNADCLVLHAGRIAGKHDTAESFCSQYQEQVDKHGVEAVIELSAENIRYAGEIAAKYGLKIALENLGKFEPLSNLELLPKLINLVNLDNVGYCLDSGHAFACGVDPVEWIEVMGSKLFSTHFHDNRGCPDWVKKSDGFISPMGIDEHLPPGFGTINWIDVISALRKIDYKYTVTFESEGWPMEDKKEGYLHAVRFWRNAEALAWRKNRNRKEV
jgi:sugar phosphate isomerase/epimerase